jgi:hypothetical protein
MAENANPGSGNESGSQAGPTSSGFDIASFVGADPVADSLAQANSDTQGAEESTEEGTQPATDGETETESETETQGEEGEESETEGEEEEETEGESEEQETADDWLPTEQEKEFPIETLAKYAKRYGYTIEQLQNDRGLQLLMKDKINSDIALRERQEGGEETDLETEEETVAQPQQLSPEEQKQKYQAFVGNIVKNHIDPNLVHALGKNLLASFGTDFSILDKADADPQLKAEIKALADSAPKVGETLVTGAADLVATMMVPVLTTPNPITGSIPILDMVERFMPGITGMWERTMYGDQWASVVNARGEDGQPMYKNLPAYGSPEFRTALEKAARSIPNFDGMIFRDAKGNPLPLPQQAQQKYMLLAQVVSGQKPNPAAAKKAFEAGKRVQKKAEQRRAAGKALGAGKGSNRLESRREQADPLAEAIQHSNTRYGGL